MNPLYLRGLPVGVAGPAANVSVKGFLFILGGGPPGHEPLHITCYSLSAGKDLSHITFMALSRKKATTIALDPEDDRLLTRAARERGVSRSEFVRQQLSLVLEQYRRHPKPASAGVIRTLSQRGNERELFGARR